MPEGLRLVGDSAYGGQYDKLTATMDAHSPKTKELFARMKSMQESLFGRVKVFKADVDDKLEKAGETFDAVVVLIQLDIDNGHPLFEV